MCFVREMSFSVVGSRFEYFWNTVLKKPVHQLFGQTNLFHKMVILLSPIKPKTAENCRYNGTRFSANDDIFLCMCNKCFFYT